MTATHPLNRNREELQTVAQLLDAAWQLHAQGTPALTVRDGVYYLRVGRAERAARIRIGSRKAQRLVDRWIGHEQLLPDRHGTPLSTPCLERELERNGRRLEDFPPVAETRQQSPAAATIGPVLRDEVERLLAGTPSAIAVDPEGRLVWSTQLAAAHSGQSRPLIGHGIRSLDLWVRRRQTHGDLVRYGRLIAAPALVRWAADHDIDPVRVAEAIVALPRPVRRLPGRPRKHPPQPPRPKYQRRYKRAQEDLADWTSELERARRGEAYATAPEVCEAHIADARMRLAAIERLRRDTGCAPDPHAV